MARLTIGDPKLDTSATASLRKVRLRARSNGSLQEAVIQAGYYAKKRRTVIYGYKGNSYGSAVWRTTADRSEYRDPINNTGSRVFSVDPLLNVSWHPVSRGSSDALTRALKRK